MSMSTTSSETTVGLSGLAALPSRHRRRRRAPWLAAIAAVLVGAGLVAEVVASGGTAPSGPAHDAEPTGLYTVALQNLSSQTQVSATLGYAGSYSVVNQAPGTITYLPPAGQIVLQGQTLYGVSGAPVVLLYGATPAYRTLSGASGTQLTGPDVAELNADLVSLGYVTSAELSPNSDEFTSWTKVGVERLQGAIGMTQNGTLSLGQAVFEPASLRITSLSASLGAAAQPGQQVLSATSTKRQVSIALDADQQSEVAVGDKVTITLPNNGTTPGVISSVGTVATTPSGGGSPTITVLVNPTDSAATGMWDQAPVYVTITTGTVANTLVVPVDALVAEAGGGFAVEVVGAEGVHRLVAVSLGLFDDADGLVQVTKTGLVAGQQVVVPKL